MHYKLYVKINNIVKLNKKKKSNQIKKKKNEVIVDKNLTLKLFPVIQYIDVVSLLLLVCRQIVYLKASLSKCFNNNNNNFIYIALKSNNCPKRYLITK